MEASVLIKNLWNEYTKITPSAQVIHDLFSVNGDFKNDHIALRTFNDPRVCIDVVAKPFIECGYEEVETYSFPDKNLRAKHYFNKTDKNAPLVFISELLLEKCSVELECIVNNALNSVDPATFRENLAEQGRMWDNVSFELYQTLRAESEYAAWTYVYGVRVNHFTVLVNSLQQFETIQAVNDFVKDAGYVMNTSGGEVKGSPKLLLEQSSTLADLQEMTFEEGVHSIPTCFYEFARRFKNEEGELFLGFHADSANKIFESTDLKLQLS